MLLTGVLRDQALVLIYSMWTSVGDREPKKRRKSSDGDKETRKRKQPKEKKTVRLKKGDGEGEEELFSFLEKEAGSEVSDENGNAIRTVWIFMRSLLHESLLYEPS
jgi:hypothetical protein